VNGGAASQAMNKTVEGIIALKQSPSNTHGAIYFNRDSDSNEIDESD
jgi:hypothetical protein